eukprot:Skav224907  [mRNA]  locus=scaffold1112:483166:491013:- [translate_table: standard]
MIEDQDAELFLILPRLVLLTGLQDPSNMRLQNCLSELHAVMGHESSFWDALTVHVIRGGALAVDGPGNCMGGDSQSQLEVRGVAMCGDKGLGNGTGAVVPCCVASPLQDLHGELPCDGRKHLVDARGTDGFNFGSSLAECRPMAAALTTCDAPGWWEDYAPEREHQLAKPSKAVGSNAARRTPGRGQGRGSSGFTRRAGSEGQSAILAPDVMSRWSPDRTIGFLQSKHVNWGAFVDQFFSLDLLDDLDGYLADIFFAWVGPMQDAPRSNSPLPAATEVEEEEALMAFADLSGSELLGQV